MTARERRYLTGQVASGRRAGLRLLDLLEVGFTPEEAVHAVAPGGLSPVAAVAAQKLAAQASFYLTTCALVLAGLVSPEALEETVAHIPAVPAAWREQYLRAS